MAELIRSIMRRNARKMRQSLTEEQVKRRSALIQARIERLSLYRQAKNIALYFSANNEVCLDGLWRSAPYQGKRCYFPVVKDDRLLFLPAKPNTPFAVNRFGIEEPQVPLEQAIAPEALDICLMPLVVFDAFCNRLGMGKGYYDKAFLNVNRDSLHHVYLLGVAYDFQRQAAVPIETWDVPLDGVVSESKVYWKNSREMQ